MGGQTALNTALALARDGVLERLGVELIGASISAIEKAEDRELPQGHGQDRSKRSRLVNTYEDALAALEHVGLPAIIRPSFTLGSEGGGIAYNSVEFEDIVRGELRLSPVSEVLIEESVLGWKEFEMELSVTKRITVSSSVRLKTLNPWGFTPVTA